MLVFTLCKNIILKIGYFASRSRLTLAIVGGKDGMDDFRFKTRRIGLGVALAIAPDSALCRESFCPCTWTIRGVGELR